MASLKRPVALLSVCLGALSWCEAAASVEGRGQLDLGYRFGQFGWSIAGTPQGTDPNVLSELEWTELGVVQLGLSGDFVLERHLWLGASLTTGSIQSGANRDSDYLGDNRTLEFSRSENGANDGDVLDADLGIGYMFRQKSYDLVVNVGYAATRQDLRLVNGVQVVSNEAVFGEPLPPLGPFDGLDSSYEARWQGPWIGGEARVPLGERSRLLGRLRLHRADYQAEANWNLRDDFEHPVSFEHNANGDGLGLHADYTRRAAQSRWGWQVGIDYERWKTAAGTDVVFLSDGMSGGTRLNEVSWSSFALSFGVAFGI
jgi:outer membrane protein Pom